MKSNQNLENVSSRSSKYQNNNDSTNSSTKKLSEPSKPSFNIPVSNNYSDHDEYSKLYPDQCNTNKYQIKNQELIRNQNSTSSSASYRSSNQAPQYPSLDTRRLSDGYKINTNKQGIDPYMCISMGSKYEKQYTSQPLETESANGQFIQKPPMISPNTSSRIQKMFNGNNTTQGSNAGCIYNGISPDSNRISNNNINSYSVSIPCPIGSTKPKLEMKFENEINSNQPESASSVLEHNQLPKIGNYDYNMMYKNNIKGSNNGYNQNQMDADNMKDGEYEEPYRRHSLPTFSTYNQQRKNSITSKAKEEIRAVSGWFINVSATSNKTLQEIIYEITRVLQLNNIPHYYDGNSTFECECLDVNDFLDQNDNTLLMTSSPIGNNYERELDDGINIDGKNGKKNKNSLRFQIEICHIPRLAAYGLHFKRLYGGVWNYKKICTKLLSQMSI